MPMLREVPMHLSVFASLGKDKPCPAQDRRLREDHLIDNKA
jgi:hypothetical protein